MLKLCWSDDRKQRRQLLVKDSGFKGYLGLGLRGFGLGFRVKDSGFKGDM